MNTVITNLKCSQEVTGLYGPPYEEMTNGSSSNATVLNESIRKGVFLLCSSLGTYSFRLSSSNCSCSFLVQLLTDAEGHPVLFFTKIALLAVYSIVVNHNDFFTTLNAGIDTRSAYFFALKIFCIEDKK